MIQINKNESKSWIECMDRNIQINPNKTAFTYLDENGNVSSEITFKELCNRAKSLAVYIMEWSEPGDRVLLLFPPGIDYVVAFYACVYADVTSVPLYSPQNERRQELIALIADNCGSKLALSTKRYVDKINKNLKESEIGTLLKNNITWKATDTLNIDKSKLWKMNINNCSDLIYLQYTSGSTSAPKGVMLDHSSTIEHSHDIVKAWSITPESIIVSWLPHYHDLGQVLSILQPVFSGVSCVLMSPAAFVKNPLLWLKAISNYRATHSAAPNFAFDLCVSSISEDHINSLDLRSLKVIANGAEPVRLTTLNKFYKTFEKCGLPLESQYPSYGLAEATLVVSTYKPNDIVKYIHCDKTSLSSNILQIVEETNSNAISIVSCGSVLENTAVEIVNAQTKELCEAGVIGEIWVNSKSLGIGYWNNKTASKETFNCSIAHEKTGSYLRTGDLGVIFKDNLYITGRIKDLVIIRGKNYYPQDIEKTVEDSHPLLRSGYSAVFSHNFNSEEKLVVAVERERFYQNEYLYNDVLNCINEAIVSEHNIDPYKILILKTGSISKTTSGKIQRQKCKAAWLDNTLYIKAEYSKVEQHKEVRKQRKKVMGENNYNIENNIEELVVHWLMKWFSNEMDLSESEINREKTFSECSLDSVNMILLHGDLEKWCNCDIDADLIWDSKSINSFCKEISALVFAAPKNRQSESENTLAVLDN